MKKKFIGQIISAKMTNTAVVAVKMWKKDRLLGKRFVQTSKFLADNPANRFVKDDWVKIEETRPISRRKHFRISAAASQQ